MDLSKYTLDKFQLKDCPVRPKCMCKCREIKLEIACNGGTKVKWYAHGDNHECICGENEFRNKIAEIADDWIRDSKMWQDYHEELKLFNQRQQKHCAKLHEQFKKELFDELGISDNPKREMLFSKAWEQGHGCGYAEVYNYARDLVDLIQ